MPAAVDVGTVRDADVTRIRHVAVVIPARDEAETIEATVDSVERARRQLPADVTSSCVVVVDASTDATRRDR